MFGLLELSLGPLPKQFKDFLKHLRKLPALDNQCLF